jgi:hypothetical protein
MEGGGDMNILKGIKLSPVSLIILVSLVLLSTFPSNGFGEDWVYTGSSVYEKEYYNPKSIKIDKVNKIINVKIKKIYTNYGKSHFLQVYKENNINIDNFLDIKYSILLFIYDYKNWKYGVTKTTHCSTSGIVLKDYESDIEWDNIVSNSILEWTLIKVLGDNNIKR